jgi:integrase
MKSEWTVTVVDRGRETLILRARSRITGRIKERKSDTSKAKPAERAAGEWAGELNRVGMTDNVRFDAAAERFEDEYAAYRRASTQSKFRSTFTAFKKHSGNPLVRSINESVIAEFSREYVKGKTPAALASILRHLKVFLRWCHRQKLLPVLPHIEMPKGATKAGGRAITLEEFERMLAAVPAIRKGGDAGAWKYLLRGLWFSGLRLSEALALSWDESEPVCIAGIDSDGPVMRIAAGSQKGGRDTVTPCVEDFATLLRETHKAERSGRVFKLSVRQRERASTVVSSIGKKANVKATAHDLRRSFATRWAKKLEAQQLRKLMRHASITTTLAFYATDDCGLAEALSRISSDKSGDIRESANVGV